MPGEVVAQVEAREVDQSVPKLPLERALPKKDGRLPSLTSPLRTGGSHNQSARSSSRLVEEAYASRRENLLQDADRGIVGMYINIGR